MVDSYIRLFQEHAIDITKLYDMLFCDNTITFKSVEVVRWIYLTKKIQHNYKNLYLKNDCVISISI